MALRSNAALMAIVAHALKGARTGTSGIDARTIRKVVDNGNGTLTLTLDDQGTVRTKTLTIS